MSQSVDPGLTTLYSGSRAINQRTPTTNDKFIPATSITVGQPYWHPSPALSPALHNALGLPPVEVGKWRMVKAEVKDVSNSDGVLTTVKDRNETALGRIPKTDIYVDQSEAAAAPPAPPPAPAAAAPKKDGGRTRRRSKASRKTRGKRKHGRSLRRK